MQPSLFSRCCQATIARAEALADRLGPLALSIVIVTGAVLAYFLLVGHPIWGTNDDAGMSTVAAGVLIAPEPSSHLLFINHWYGWFISRLYTWHPGIPWYGLGHIAIISLSLVVFNYAILRLRRDWFFRLTSALATVAVVLPAFWHLQFTIVAGLSALAGTMLLMSLVAAPPEGRMRLALPVVTVWCLLVLGAAIRMTSLQVIAVLAAPLFVVQCSLVYLRAGGERTRRLAVPVVVILVAGVLVAGGEVLERRHYERSLTWSRWLALNHVKSAFTDYNAVRYNPDTHSAFASVGWNKTDYRMITSFQYVDPVRYAPAKFRRVVERVNRSDAPYWRRILTPKTWEVSGKAIIDDLELYMPKMASLFFCILVAGVLAFRRERSMMLLLQVGAITVGVAVVAFYLYVVLDRNCLRVLLLVWTGILWMMLFLAATALRRRPGERGAHPVRAAVVRAVLACTMVALLVTDVAYGRRVVEPRVKKHRRLNAMVRRWVEGLPRDAVVYLPGASWRYEHHLPLEPFTWFRSIDGLILTGCRNQSPCQRRWLHRLGLNERAFFGHLAGRDHVYMYNPKARMSWAALILSDHYREVYGIEMSLAADPNLPNLCRMEFAPGAERREPARGPAGLSVAASADAPRSGAGGADRGVVKR